MLTLFLSLALGAASPPVAPPYKPADYSALELRVPRRDRQPKEPAILPPWQPAPVVIYPLQAPMSWSGFPAAGCSGGG